MFKVISGVLPRNATTLILSDSTITNNSIFEVYTDNCDVIPYCVSVDGNNINITFDNSSTTSTQIKVLINNINGELSLNASLIDYEIVGTEITNQGDFNSTVWIYINNIESNIGNLTELSTINKDSLVSAINECKTNIDSNTNNIGNLTELETTENDNLVNAINDCFQSVSSGKSLIASAITDKGIGTLATDTFETMAENISNIQSGANVFMVDGNNGTVARYGYSSFATRISNNIFTVSGNNITVNGNIDVNIIIYAHAKSSGSASCQLKLTRNGTTTRILNNSIISGRGFAYLNLSNYSLMENDILQVSNDDNNGNLLLCYLLIKGV